MMITRQLLAVFMVVVIMMMANVVVVDAQHHHAQQEQQGSIEEIMMDLKNPRNVVVLDTAVLHDQNDTNTSWSRSNERCDPYGSNDWRKPQQGRIAVFEFFFYQLAMTFDANPDYRMFSGTLGPLSNTTYTPPHVWPLAPNTRLDFMSNLSALLNVSCSMLRIDTLDYTVLVSVNTSNVTEYSPWLIADAKRVVEDGVALLNNASTPPSAVNGTKLVWSSAQVDAAHNIRTVFNITSAQAGYIPVDLTKDFALVETHDQLTFYKVCIWFGGFGLLFQLLFFVVFMWSPEYGRLEAVKRSRIRHEDMAQFDY